MATPVWGWAEPGEEVTVTVAGQEAKAKAGEDGRWMVKLAPMKAGGPYELVVRGKNEIKLDDVMVGDVWLCSGQSNMRWEVLSSSTGKAGAGQGGFAEIAAVLCAAARVRPAGGGRGGGVEGEHPGSRGRGSRRWISLGREINKELDVPIGLIDSGWSGSRIDPWIPPEGFASIPEYPDMGKRLAAGRERWKAELLPWAVKQGHGRAAARGVGEGRAVADRAGVADQFDGDEPAASVHRGAGDGDLQRDDLPAAAAGAARGDLVPGRVERALGR